MKKSILFLGLALSIANAPAAAQKTERDSAIALVLSYKPQIALPMLERVALKDPKDVEIHEHLGLVLLTMSANAPDAESRRLQRVRARTALETAVKLGSRNSQAIAVLANIPPDGGNDVTYSSNAQVDSVMRKGEKAFSSGDYREAFAQYQMALALDPMQYTAALYSGDTFLHVPALDSAYMWYARATQINPDRETAWRYWSDVLLKNGKLDEARDKAVQAMIAEPYSRFSRSALGEWAGRSKTRIGFPLIDLPIGTKEKPAAAARLAFDSVRLAWKGTDVKGGAPFKAAFPTETVYRHSVAEERAALWAAYNAEPASIATANIKKMDDAGVLEAFILIVAADDGIATEYPNYRRDFRDVLEKFWMSFVIGAPFSQ